MLEQISIVCFFVISMSILARMAGGGIWPNRPSGLAELLFATPIGIAYGGASVMGGLAIAWTYLFMQTGHGTAFAMGRHPEYAQNGRKQFLSRFIDPICMAIRKPLGGMFYCWAFMGLKGLLIGIPVAPYGLFLAVLWPLGYELGYRIENTSKYGELISGAFAGLIVGLSWAA